MQIEVKDLFTVLYFFRNFMFTLDDRSRCSFFLLLLSSEFREDRCGLHVNYRFLVTEGKKLQDIYSQLSIALGTGLSGVTLEMETHPYFKINCVAEWVFLEHGEILDSFYEGSTDLLFDSNSRRLVTWVFSSAYIR